MTMRYLLILAIAALYTACQEPAVVTTLNATLSGAEDDAQLVVSGPDYEKELALIDGKIQDTLMISKAGLYSFRTGGQRLETYLEPGESVTITGEAKDFGAKATFANTRQQSVGEYFRKNAEVDEEYLSMRSLFDLQPDSMAIALATGEQKLRDLLSTAELPESVRKMQAEAIDYHTARLAYLYPLYTDPEGDLPPALQNPLEGIDLTNDEKFAVNPNYRILVNSVFSMKLEGDTMEEYVEDIKQKIAAMPDGNIRNALLHDELRYLVGPNDQLEDLMSFYREYSSDKENIAAMEEEYTAFQALMKGNPSPTFDYENHKGGETALEDLRGKYVYVDVWATWCGPCIGEIPSLKEKEEKYHNANIEFVSISIDDPTDHDKWFSMVNERQLGGTQLMADQAWESDFPKNYRINGIPRFILIDPEGNIVSADAPRPSDDALDELLEKEGLAGRK